MAGNVKIIDLTHPIYNGMVVFPVLPKTYILEWHHYEPYKTNLLMFSDHASTHVDATNHFNPKGEGIDKMPLEIMYGDGVVLDFSHKKSGESISRLDVEKALEKVGEKIKPDDILLFETGASRLWGMPKYAWYGVEIARDTLIWLIDRGVKVIGVDAVTIDIDRENYPSHNLMKEREFYHIENLTNLDKIPKPRFKFIGFPLKLTGASASPIRAVAIVED